MEMTTKALEWCRETENWWYPSSVRDRNPSKYILFDTLDGKTQIIRSLDRDLHEYSRITVDPRIWGYKDEKIHREMESVERPLGPLCLSDCFFGFYKLVPGINPEEIIKRLIVKAFEWGDKANPPSVGVHHTNVWMTFTKFVSLVSGYGLFEILWSLGYERNLYGSRIEWIPLVFLESHRRSFLIARKYGVRFENPRTLMSWIDTIKLLEKNQMDIKSPKYIAAGFLETHNRLVSKASKRIFLVSEEEEKEYQVSKGKYLGWEKTQGDLKVIPVQSVSDCLKTGKELQNCCYSAGYHTNQDSLLLKIYVSGVLTELAEIGISNRRILQCLGYQNKESSRHKEIIGFLKDIIKDLW